MANISGTTGNDTLVGTADADTINGLTGDDLLRGEAGADSIIGGGGADTVDYSTSPAPVTVTISQPGSFGSPVTGTAADGFGAVDTLSSILRVMGSPFADSISGDDVNSSVVFLSGGAGNDTLVGGSLGGILTGGPGNDSLVSGSSINSSTADYSDAPMGLTIDLGSGTVQDGFGGTDTLTQIRDANGTAFADMIIGTSGINDLDGLAGNDTILGGDGADQILPGPGDDQVDGGPGLDELSYSTAPSGIIIDLVAGIADDMQGDRDTISGFEVVRGSIFADSIMGDDGNNFITGNGGNDTIEGNGGDDSLSAGADSSLSGGAGNDTLNGGDRAILIGGDGNDRLLGGFNSILSGGGGADTLQGSVFDYSSSPGPVVIDLFTAPGGGLGQGIGTAQDGFGSLDELRPGFSQRVVGSAFADTILGANGGDSLDGGDGADSIDGELGIDNLTGGNGDDTLISGEGSFGILRGDAGNDRLIGGPGNDHARYDSSPAAVLVDLAAGTAQDGFGFTDTLSSIETVTGSDFNDTQRGDESNNFLSAGNGDDLLFGGAGNDTVSGGGGFDTADYGTSLAGLSVNLQTSVSGGGTITGQALDGLGGTDTLFNIERIIGSPFDDSIVGSDVANVLEAGNGNDTLAGGNGDDSLIGGPGIDRAVFSGPVSAYTVTFGASITVVGAEGSDTLSGIELLQFANQNVTVPGAVSIANASLSEGNSGSATLVFTISLAAPVAGPVSVTATTANGTASAGSDYVAKTQTVTIPGGQTSTTFSVTVNGDTVFEPDETFTVTLTNPVGAVLGAQASATGTILNDDAAPVTPVASIANASIVEGEGGTANLVFTISLSAVPTQDMSVTATTQDESAKAGGDYAATSAVVTIPAGQTSATFSVPITGDTAIEIDESFAVVLSNPTSGAVVSATAGAARGFILNDDLIPSIAINGQTLNGTGGDDFLVASALNDSVRGEGGADTEFGNEQSDILLGGAGNDFILGDFPGNFLDGSADFIDAGDGNDNVFGGGGDDTVFGGNGDDLIGGDFGDNLIFGGDGNNALIGFGGADTIEGGNDGDIVFGLSGPDVISTKGGFDLIIAGGDLDGPSDADFIDVADGGSSVFAGSGDDTIIAGNGNDFMLGESGADVMRAGGGADIVIAGPGNDTLDGGAGNDVIIPEGGDDLIAGGAGADLFRYPAGIAVNADRITDFAPADDTVELGPALGFANGTAALAAVTQVGADAVLTLPNAAGTIAFAGVQASALTAADFVIV